MFLKILIVSLISIFMVKPAFAGCSKPVYHLIETESAPCTGYLFSPEKELELRIMNEDYKLLKKEVEIKDQQVIKLQQSIILLEEINKKEEQKSELWRSAAEKSTQKYIESEQTRGVRDWLFLIGGVILTVGAGYAVGAAHQ